METLKSLVKKYLKHFAYFYHYLRYRMFIALSISLTVGVLDGFGLAMFMPLLQMLDGQQNANPKSLGNLRFLVDGMSAIGLSLTVTSVLCVIMVFFIFKGVARFVEAYYKVVLSRYFIQRLRFSNIEKLSGYSFKQFVMADVGRIQNTLTAEVTKVLHAYKSYFMSVQAGVLVLVYVVLAFLANPQFSAIVIAGAVLSNLAFRRLYIRTKEASKSLTKGGHKFHALIIQKINFFKYLRATGQIDQFSKKIKEVIIETEQITKRMGWYNAIISSAKEPLVVLVVVLVVIVQVAYFSKSIALIILSLLFFYRGLTFLLNLQTQWNTFLQATGALENMKEFMDELSSHQEKTGKENLAAFKNKLQLANASFRFGEKCVFQNFNITINKNETVAFVGESGSGKTTLVNIMAGLMPLDAGELLIDGTSSKQINIKSYQKLIGYITQEPVIFSDSIYNNVTFWAPRTPENVSRFWTALEKASIRAFVEDLDNKEDSLLGNNGVLISGGQKQRLSIARELFKDIEILIMDEATSALDSETERVIQKNIDELKGKYTILIVAHRLATIKNADRVVLLTKGKIESIGTFEHLKTTSEMFEKMVALQEV
jgi:ABC-type multidrug transport system fused ATPase/permease subunit